MAELDVAAFLASTTGRAAFVRDDALASMPEAGPAYSIDEIQEAPNEHTAFRVKGHMTVPLYMTEDKAGSFLTRDDDGMPFQPKKHVAVGNYELCTSPDTEPGYICVTLKTLD